MNCGHRCPIMGQLEISSKMEKDFEGKWKVHSGVLFLNENPESSNKKEEDSEENFEGDL